MSSELTQYSPFTRRMNGSIDLHNTKYHLANGLSLLARSQKLGNKDKAKIREFLDHLKAKGVSDGRLARYVFMLRIFGEHIEVPLAKARRKNIEQAVLWLRSRNLSPHTIQFYVVATKRFYKFLRSGNTDTETPYPEEVRWLKSTRKENESRQPNFFTPEEVKRMIEVCTRARDKALIAVSFESGFRPGELLNLNTGDIGFDELGAKARVRGKTGERTVRLISSAKLLSAYLEVHPYKNDPYSPLWLTESINWRDKRLSWVRWNRTVKKIAKKAGIAKQVNAYLFRHGSATEHAKFLSDFEMKTLFGWSMASRSPAVYIHLSGRDLDTKLAQIYGGKPIESTRPEFSPVICPKCSEKNSPGMRYCGKCATPLSAEELERSRMEPIELERRLNAMEKIIQKYSKEKNDDFQNKI